MTSLPDVGTTPVAARDTAAGSAAAADRRKVVDPAAPTRPDARADVCELSIVLPCLNESETLAVCIRKALGSLARLGVTGEVIIADNGSTDGSQAIATAEGARRGSGGTARLRRRARAAGSRPRTAPMC